MQCIAKLFFVSKLPFLLTTSVFLVLTVRGCGLNSHLFRKKAAVNPALLSLAACPLQLVFHSTSLSWGPLPPPTSWLQSD